MADSNETKQSRFWKIGAVVALVANIATIATWVQFVIPPFQPPKFSDGTAPVEPKEPTLKKDEKSSTPTEVQQAQNSSQSLPVPTQPHGSPGSTDYAVTIGGTDVAPERVGSESPRTKHGDAPALLVSNPVVLSSNWDKKIESHLWEATLGGRLFTISFHPDNTWKGKIASRSSGFTESMSRWWYGDDAYGTWSFRPESKEFIVRVGKPPATGHIFLRGTISDDSTEKKIVLAQGVRLDRKD